MAGRGAACGKQAGDSNSNPARSLTQHPRRSLTKSLHFGVLTSARRARILLGMAKEPTNLTVESAVKREARLAAGRRLISLSEYTEIAWAAAIAAEKRSGQ